MRAAWRASFPRFQGDVWLISVATALGAGGFLGMVQLLRVIYLLRLGHGPEFVGTLFAAGAFSFTLFSLPSGALGGRFGPRRMMIVGGITNVLGMATLPLTEFVPQVVQPFWPLLTEVIASAGWSMMIVNQIPALVVATTAEDRRSAYAFKEAITGLGTFLGALIGGMLPATFAGWLGLTTADPAPYRYSLVVGVVVSLVGLVPLMRVGPMPGVPRSRIRPAFRPPLLPLGLLVICAFLNHSAVASCRAFTYAYMDIEFGLPTSLVGMISSVGMLVAVPGALAGSRLSARHGTGRTMMVASLGIAFSLLTMGLLRRWAAAGAGTVGVLALSSMWIPAYQALQMEMADPQWRSLVAGASSMATSLGFGTMSLAGGHLVTSIGYRQTFLLGGALALSSAALVWQVRRRRAETREQPVQSLKGG